VPVNKIVQHPPSYVFSASLWFTFFKIIQWIWHM
jgi:hypothetical protein